MIKEIKMLLAELSIHTHEKEVPNITINDYNGFYTVDIMCGELACKIFLDSPQQLTNFKNNLLWAFEALER